jgi:diguanylate cyclase (GGDEF)-like protein
MIAQYPEVTPDEFLAHCQPADQIQARSVLRFFMWATWVLLYIDYSLLGWSQNFWIMLSLRGVMWIVSWYLLRPVKSVQDRRADNKFRRPLLEKDLYLWTMAVMLVQMSGNVIAPVSYLGHFFIDAWICLMVSVAIPLRVVRLRQLVIAYFFACVTLSLTKAFSSIAFQLTVLTALLLGAYSGQVLARQRQMYRKKIFSAELELQRKENTDPLTGIANRREFLRVTDSELQRHLRLGKPLSLLMLDLDHLKQINSEHGAIAGDMVLVEVSKRMRRATRSYDCLARYSAEEFSVLLPEANEEIASKIAARAQATIIAMPVAASGKELKVSASIGVATMLEGDTIESMLRRAEDALHQAQQAARQALTLPSPEQEVFT